jgi:acyl-CoA reductase-like NAD-dependent aldehyde dehydrogenase
MTELLLEAGIPENAVQIITGRGAKVGKWLVANNKINAVSMTGSTEAGREIAQIAASYLHRVFLELGGNDAMIIFEMEVFGPVFPIIEFETICDTQKERRLCHAAGNFKTWRG